MFDLIRKGRKAKTNLAWDYYFEVHYDYSTDPDDTPSEEDVDLPDLEFK